MKPVFAVSIGDNLQWGKSDIQSYFPDIGTFLNIILKNSLTIISLLLVVLLIIGGLQFIMGAGDNDPKKAQAAKNMITDAVIGFMIVFVAFFVIQIVEVVTGLKILNPGF